ncbi:MAG: hypothetical protein ACKV2U_13190, partial [Bryobacteraceae bacterium]
AGDGRPEDGRSGRTDPDGVEVPSASLIYVRADPQPWGWPNAYTVRIDVATSLIVEMVRGYPNVTKGFTTHPPDWFQAAVRGTQF